MGNILFRIMHFNQCVKSVRIRSFLVRISLHLDWTQSKCGKIRTRKTPNTDNFYEVTIIPCPCEKEYNLQGCIRNAVKYLVVSIPVWQFTARVRTSEEAITLIVLLLLLNTYMISVIHGCIYSMELCIVWNLIASYTTFFLSLLIFLLQRTVAYSYNVFMLNCLGFSKILTASR